MDLNKQQLRLLGICFLLPIFCFGIGSSLIEPLLMEGEILPKPIALTGTVLITLNSLIVGVIGVLFFKAFYKQHIIIATSYLAARIVEAILLLIGLGSVMALQNSLPLGLTPSMIAFGTGIHFQTYQLAMLILSLASLPLLLLFLRENIMPKFLSIWGLIGYALLGIGTLLELNEIPVGVTCSILGGIFELAWGIWLIKKGLTSKDSTLIGSNTFANAT